MKSGLLFFILVFVSTASATSSATTSAAAAAAVDVNTDAVTSAEEIQVLTLLNNFCGDAWCEGSYDIEFRSIKYNQANNFYILAAATTVDTTDESTSQSIGFKCDIQDPNLILDTLTASTGESLYHAERRLFAVITDCIDTALYTKP